MTPAKFEISSKNQSVSPGKRHVVALGAPILASPGENIAATGMPSGTQLTQSNRGTFSSDITALDSRLRCEKDGHERVALEHDIHILRKAPNSANSKRFIGRQMQIRAGKYRMPEARWLRPVHMDAE